LDRSKVAFDEAAWLHCMWKGVTSSIPKEASFF
jgi:hypothetical protein